MSLEIHRTLVLSTAHMTQADSELLLYSSDYGLVAYEMDEYGWMIYVNDEYLQLTVRPMTKFSDGFRQAIKLAQDNSCEWLRFDRDGPLTMLLPQYDW